MSSTDHSRPYQGHTMNTCEVNTGKSIKSSTKLIMRWANMGCIRKRHVPKWSRSFAVLPLAMLQHRVIPSTRPWRSIRFASQLSQSSTDGLRLCMFCQTLPTVLTSKTAAVKTTAMTPGRNAENARKPSSILSRMPRMNALHNGPSSLTYFFPLGLSDRPQSRIRRNSDTEQKNPNGHVEVAAAVHRTPRPRATSFISARSAQKRDHAAEKWFTDVRELDIHNVDQPDGLKSLPRKKRMWSEPPKQHEMRPRTDLNALFAPSTVRCATSLRLQTKRELAGDYTSYLPGRYADPHRLPIAYARLVLGRNKHIPLNAQTGALNVIEEAIRGKTTRQGK